MNRFFIIVKFKVNKSVINSKSYWPKFGEVDNTIITSSLSYRNLLEQLININPSITKELQKKYGVPEPQKITILGSELILTAENLVFYKKAGSMGMEKMYFG